mmetsp:Transcript_12358/g.18668  ORF Transcript_12358/g.18668 Transcript_12358/m.18668 type:complete len:88 (+) Transcript_12358:138-401(+)
MLHSSMHCIATQIKLHTTFPLDSIQNRIFYTHATSIFPSSNALIELARSSACCIDSSVSVNSASCWSAVPSTGALTTFMWCGTSNNI